MTDLGQRVLDALGETFRKQAGALLSPVVEALVEPATTIDDLVEPTERGWAAIYDLDTTPAPATLGAATGTQLPAGLTLEQQRAYLRDQPARRRGSVGAVRAAAEAAAPGRRVDLFERDGSPWHLEVRLTGGAADAPTIDAVTAAVQLQKPVGITLEVQVVVGATYNHMGAEHGPTYNDQAADFGTYDDERTHIPEGGTTP